MANFMPSSQDVPTKVLRHLSLIFLFFWKNFVEISNCFWNLNILGGPLEQGDIEELADQFYIICPWHSFDFSLSTGLSSTGLKVYIYFFAFKLIVFETKQKRIPKYKSNLFLRTFLSVARNCLVTNSINCVSNSCD